MAGVVIVQRAMPPGANAATVGLITGGATPAEKVFTWDFDPTTVEYMDFLCLLKSYNGGGLTFTLPWASGATTGDVIWSIGVRRLTDDAEDIDSTAHSYDYNDVTDTTASAAGELSYPTLAFTDGSDMDSWADGELAIVRVRRRADQGGDTLNSNDARLISLFGFETV